MATDRGPSATQKDLTDEMWRILRAISERRMNLNPAGRYIIPGEDRPDAKSREKLRKRGLIEHRYTQGIGSYWCLTNKGWEVLDRVHG